MQFLEAEQILYETSGDFSIHHILYLRRSIRYAATSIPAIIYTDLNPGIPLVCSFVVGVSVGDGGTAVDGVGASVGVIASFSVDTGVAVSAGVAVTAGAPFV